MKRLLRSSDPTLGDYAYVLLFVAAYVTTMVLVISPELFRADPRETSAAVESD